MTKTLLAVLLSGMSLMAQAAFPEKPITVVVPYPPGGATDILVSEAFRWAFQRNEQYGFAAAYSVLIFCVLFAWSQVTKRISGEESA